VARLVADLGERVVGVRRLGILVVDVAGQHLDQDDLEPQSGAGHARQLLLGQFDALLRCHLLPERGAVERHPLHRHVGEVIGDRRVPVDVQ